MEIYLHLNASLHVKHDDGNFEGITLPGNARYLYGRMFCDGARASVRNVRVDAGAMLHDLGFFIAGKKDPSWGDCGLLDGPGWAEAITQAVIDASGVTDQPEVSPGPMDRPIRFFTG